MTRIEERIHVHSRRHVPDLPASAAQRTTKNTTSDTFNVFLSAAVAEGKTAKVAWFIIG